jgi:hypothetical protein
VRLLGSENQRVKRRRTASFVATRRAWNGVGASILSAVDPDERRLHELLIRSVIHIMLEL